MSFTYSVREGLSGLGRAPFAAIASTSAMAAALVLVGLFALVGFGGREVGQWLRQRVGQVDVMLEAETPEGDRQTLVRRVRALPGVDSVTYVSPQEAQQRFRRDFGEEGEIYYDEPFLPASIEVQVAPAYAASDSLNALIGEVATWEHVDEAGFNAPLVARVQRNLRLLTWIGAGLGALVVFTAIFLVANTIRLTVYARRLLIRTMKLVGATDRFIRRPFVIEGILQGVLAGVLAAGVVWGIHYAAVGYVPGLKPIDECWQVLLALPAGGLLLGWVGSSLAVRRFIRHVALH